MAFIIRTVRASYCDFVRCVCFGLYVAIFQAALNSVAYFKSGQKWSPNLKKTQFQGFQFLADMVHGVRASASIGYLKRISSKTRAFYSISSFLYSQPINSKTYTEKLNFQNIVLANFNKLQYNFRIFLAQVIFIFIIITNPQVHKINNII